MSYMKRHLEELQELEPGTLLIHPRYGYGLFSKRLDPATNRKVPEVLRIPVKGVVAGSDSVASYVTRNEDLTGWKKAIVCDFNEVPVNIEGIDLSPWVDIEETEKLPSAMCAAIRVARAQNAHLPIEVRISEPLDFGAQVTVTTPDGFKEKWIRQYDGTLSEKAQGRDRKLPQWRSSDRLTSSWEALYKRGIVTLGWGDGDE